MLEEEIPRPSPQDVARRAFAQAVFHYRTGYEAQWLDMNPRQRELKAESWHEDIADMAAFLRKSGLENALSSNERTLHDRELGKWHSRDVKEFGWGGERLIPLLWALKRVKAMPPIWKTSGGFHLFAHEKADRWDSFVSVAELRPNHEIERMNDYVECVRLRQVTPDEFEGIPWLAAKAEGFGGGSPINSDLPIDGVPFWKVDSATRDTIRSLGLERQRALDWVLGYEDDLDAHAREV